MKNKVFKWLYGLFVFIPALAVFSTCAYVSLNENAKDSATMVETGQYTQVDKFNYPSQTDIDNGVFYGSTLYHMDSLTSDDIFGFTDIDFTIISCSSANFIIYNVDETYVSEFISSYGTLEIISDGSFVYFYADSNENVYVALNYTSFEIFDFDFIIRGSFDSQDLYSLRSSISPSTLLLYDYVEVSSTSLDNAFYYATYQVEHNGFFSWVKGNFLYTGMNDFCNIFNAKDTFVSFYLTYVLTISLCYLAFEVLMLFINMARDLIHSFNKEWW